MQWGPDKAKGTVTVFASPMGEICALVPCLALPGCWMFAGARDIGEEGLAPVLAGGRARSSRADEEVRLAKHV